MNEKIKFVLIGCGKIANGVHIPALKRLVAENKIEMLGTSDLILQNAKSASLRFRINKYSDDWKSLVEEVAPDAVSICLPPRLNAQVSKEAAQMGVHVFCEKPPAINLEEAIMMEQASSMNSKQTHMTAFNRRHSPIFKKLKSHSDKLGQPINFYGSFSRPSMGLLPVDKVDNWIISDSIHVIDTSIAIMGYPDSIIVNKKSIGSSYPNVWSIKLINENGFSLLNLNYAAGRRYERFEWSGSGYSAVAELPLKGFWFQDGSIEKKIKSDYKDDLSMSYGFYHEYKYFIKCIKTNNMNPDTDFNYAKKITYLIERILDAEQGEIIKLENNIINGTVINNEKEKDNITIKVTENKKNILILHDRKYFSKYFQQIDLDKFEGKYNIDYCNSKGLNGISECDIIISGYESLIRLRAKDIKNAKNLKLVIAVGSSVNFLNPKILIDKNIMIFNTAKALAESVAEHCLMASLSGLRQLIKYDANVRKGNWNNFFQDTDYSFGIVKRLRKFKIPNWIKAIFRPLYVKKVDAIILKNQKTNFENLNKFSDLTGQTVGLIGWGHIARSFVKLLKPFKCKVLVNSDHITDDELIQFNLHSVGLGELLSTSKIISIHKGVNEKSLKLIGKSEIAMLKPNTVLINTARGEVIDETALIERLMVGDIQAFLDVFENEPIEKKNPLIKLSNVTLTPHIACNSIQNDLRIGKELTKIIKNWDKGKNISPLDIGYISNMT